MGTGASHGKCVSSEETLLPSGGGDTADMAMPVKMIHVFALSKPEVGMVNPLGVTVSGEVAKPA